MSQRCQTEHEVDKYHNKNGTERPLNWTILAFRINNESYYIGCFIYLTSKCNFRVIEQLFETMFILLKSFIGTCGRDMVIEV